MIFENVWEPLYLLLQTNVSFLLIHHLQSFLFLVKMHI